MQENIVWFEEINLSHLESVGGKNASLGEMIHYLAKLGIQVPRGFASTVKAYQTFLTENNLTQTIQKLLKNLDVNDLSALTEIGFEIRQKIVAAPFSKGFTIAIEQAYEKLIQSTHENLTVAVRSSATMEDLAEASFAGQQETFLNVQGVEKVLIAIKNVFASLFNDRAISYRIHQGFNHENLGLSAGVQQMVRSDLAASGVAFTQDTESGFENVILITSSYGLGEPIVQGAVNPDEFYVYKPNLIRQMPAILRRNRGEKTIKMIYAEPQHEPNVKTLAVEEKQRSTFSLTDQEVEQLANQALLIEKHYGKPMDIEWAKDGLDSKLYIVQARPITTKNKSKQCLERYQLMQEGKVKTQGRSVGQKIGGGAASVIFKLTEMNSMQSGNVLVTDMTDPDWEPIMKRASAIVTNRGGRTCHAAIIARELGIPAVVGCSDATEKIKTGEKITVNCAEGETGYVYEGLLNYEVQRSELTEIPKLPFKIMLNVGNPENAFAAQTIPNDGVGLARIEFMISQQIGIHPNALLNFENLPSDLKNKILERTAGYSSPVNFYIEKLAEGISVLACAFHPKPVIVRLSDFKSNEYANLLGGELFEPHEENPMIGFRGASRYIAKEFRECFALECHAIRKVREELGLTNVEVMIPFVRTVKEAAQVIDLLADYGLVRGKNGLRIIMMCEIPSNALLAEQFLEYFDGFSIGSNDLTQLTLGLDRDSGLVANDFDERNDAVKALLAKAIQACNNANKYIGICGQGPSDHPDFAQWLVEQGIGSVSLNPDSVIQTILYLANNDKSQSKP